jgi:lauroyl/myristoyl acyltransferase
VGLIASLLDERGLSYDDDALDVAEELIHMYGVPESTGEMERMITDGLHDERFEMVPSTLLATGEAINIYRVKARIYLDRRLTRLREQNHREVNFR